MGHVVELQNVLLPRPHRFRASMDCKLSLCSSLNGMKSLHRCPGPKYPLATCMDHGPLLKLIRLRALAEMELDVLFLGWKVSSGIATSSRVFSSVAGTQIVKFTRGLGKSDST